LRLLRIAITIFAQAMFIPVLTILFSPFGQLFARIIRAEETTLQPVLMAASVATLVPFLCCIGVFTYLWYEPIRREHFSLAAMSSRPDIVFMVVKVVLECVDTIGYLPVILTALCVCTAANIAYATFLPCSYVVKIMYIRSFVFAAHFFGNNIHQLSFLTTLVLMLMLMLMQC